jgi:enoyl-CoA hydratase/carnithine racemase
MTEQTEPLLLVERDGRVAIVTLNRPKQLNALSVALRAEIVLDIVSALVMKGDKFLCIESCLSEDLLEGSL